jgi:hypothetical protein
MKTRLESFPAYVSLWVAHTQIHNDIEALLDLHHRGAWGDADPRDKVANEHKLAHQRGQVVSVLYSARHHRLRFTSDFATKLTPVSADQPDVSGGS